MHSYPSGLPDTFRRIATREELLQKQGSTLNAEWIKLMTVEGFIEDSVRSPRVKNFSKLLIVQDALKTTDTYSIRERIIEAACFTQHGCQAIFRAMMNEPIQEIERCIVRAIPHIDVFDEIDERLLEQVRLGKLDLQL